MEKKRWIAWALALFMVATPCMTFAQEISGAASSPNESESNESVNPDKNADKTSEQDRADAAEKEKVESSAESAENSEEGATGEQDSAEEKKGSSRIFVGLKSKSNADCKINLNM